MPRWAMRSEVALFVLLVGAYAYFYPAGGWNQNSRFDLTRAIVERHEVAIDAYRHNTFDLAQRGGHAYCEKAPGVSFLAAIPYGVIHSVAGTPRRIDDAAYLATIGAVAVPSAVGGVMLLMLLEALGVAAARRAVVAVGYGLGTPALAYSTMLYGHQVAAALLVSAFALLARARRLGPRISPRPLVVGALLAGSVAVEYPAVLGAAVLVAYAATFVRGARPWAWMALGAAGPTVVLCAYHAAAFGGPLTLGYAFSIWPERHAGVFMGLGAIHATALANILVTDFRGLFFSSPWLLLAGPGFWTLVRQPALRAEAIVCAAVFVLFVWMNASMGDWQGGWTAGPRYLVPAIPFVAACAACARATTPPGRALQSGVLGLCAPSAAFMLVLVAVDPQPNVAIGHPFRDYLWPAFLAGRVARNAQGIDDVAPGADGVPHAWNIGERLGLTGLWTLLPLVVFCAAAGAWLAIASRRASQSSLDGA